MVIGINWKAIWKPVWKPVWQTEVVPIPPEPEPVTVHGAGMSRGYVVEAFRQQAIALDDEEILLILSEAIPVIDKC
jgi:hypothetical protein